MVLSDNTLDRGCHRAFSQSWLFLLVPPHLLIFLMKVTVLSCTSKYFLSYTCLAFITYHFALALLLSFYAWNQGNYWWASLDGRWRNAVKVWDCGRSWQWFDSAVLFFLSFLIVVKKSRNVKSTFLKLKQSNLFSDFGFAGSWLLSMGFL